MTTAITKNTKIYPIKTTEHHSKNEENGVKIEEKSSEECWGMRNTEKDFMTRVLESKASNILKYESPTFCYVKKTNNFTTSHQTFCCKEGFLSSFTRRVIQVWSNEKNPITGEWEQTDYRKTKEFYVSQNRQQHLPSEIISYPATSPSEVEEVEAEKLSTMLADGSRQTTKGLEWKYSFGNRDVKIIRTITTTEEDLGDGRIEKKQATKYQHITTTDHPYLGLIGVSTESSCRYATTVGSDNQKIVSDEAYDCKAENIPSLEDVRQLEEEVANMLVEEEEEEKVANILLAEEAANILMKVSNRFI